MCVYKKADGRDPLFTSIVASARSEGPRNYQQMPTYKSFTGLQKITDKLIYQYDAWETPHIPKLLIGFVTSNVWVLNECKNGRCTVAVKSKLPHCFENATSNAQRMLDSFCHYLPLVHRQCGCFHSCSKSMREAAARGHGSKVGGHSHNTCGYRISMSAWGMSVHPNALRLIYKGCLHPMQNMIQRHLIKHCTTIAD